MNNSDALRQELETRVAEMRDRIATLEASLTAHEHKEREIAKVLNVVPVLVCVAGLDGYYKRVNSAFEQVLGYSEEESLSRPFMEFIHPDDHATAQRHLEQLAKGDLVVNFEDRNICKDGTHRWIMWTVVPLPNQEVVYGIGIDITEQKHAQDVLRESHQKLEQRVEVRTEQLVEANWRLREEIEERKQTEEALNRSQSRYRSLIESTNDYVWEVDRDGVVTFITPQVEQVLGYKPEEVIGKRPLDFLDPKEFTEEAMRAFREIVAAGKPFFKEEVGIHKDGSRVFGETTGVPFHDDAGNWIGYWGITRDMTERRRSREQLAVFKRFAETSVQGFGMSDLEGNLTYVNKALCKLFGEENPEDPIGKNVSTYYPEQTQKSIANEVLPAVLEHGAWRGELPVVSKSGEVTPTLQYPFLIRDENGEPYCLANVVTDISERKTAEEELQRNLRQLRKMLQAQDRERQLIAYEIHDDLAQQLAAAVMHFETHQQHHADASQDDYKSYRQGMRTLKHSLAEARRLISGLRPPILDESGIVAAIRHLVHDIAAQGGPAVELLSNVTFDRLEPVLENAIFRIVQESLTNVQQHSQSDTACVELTEKNGYVMLRVSDQGVGFDLDSVDERCFGLTGIRERARVFGGRAEIVSTPGNATTVKAQLPIAIKNLDEPTD